MTSEAARALGEDLALAKGAATGSGIVSGEVIDVTDTGVNLSVSGALLVKLFGAEDAEVERFQSKAAESAQPRRLPPRRV